MTFYVSQWGSYPHPVHDGLTIWEPVAITNSGWDKANGWAAIDLRPNPDTAPASGYALVWTAFALPAVPTGTWLLAATTDSTLSTQVRNRISTLLGVTIPSGSTFRQAVRQLMTAEATGSANGRWRQVLPSAGQFQVALGDLQDLWAAG